MKGMNSRTKRNMKWIVIFLLPVMLLVTAYYIYPIIFLMILSFSQWNGIDPIQFIGINNFIKLFSNSVFLIAARNSAIWALTAAILQILLALLLALILARKPKGWGLFRTVYFLPQVISAVSLASMWLMLYNPVYGPINTVLESIGLEHLSRNWLGDTDTALFAVIFSKQIYVGYFLVIILSGIMSVPRELYESAMMDGANSVKQDLYITIPIIKPILLTAATLAIAFGLRQFGTTFIMTKGGPAHETEVLALFLYNRMTGSRYGEAAATGLFFIIIGIVVVKMLRQIFKESDDLETAQQ